MRTGEPEPKDWARKDYLFTDEPVDLLLILFHLRGKLVVDGGEQ
jgi:hypothetical protein